MSGIRSPHQQGAIKASSLYLLQNVSLIEGWAQDFVFDLPSFKDEGGREHKNVLVFYVGPGYIEKQEGLCLKEPNCE